MRETNDTISTDPRTLALNAVHEAQSAVVAARADHFAAWEAAELANAELHRAKKALVRAHSVRAAADRALHNT